MSATPDPSVPLSAIRALVQQWRERVAVCRRISAECAARGELVLGRAWAEEADHKQESITELTALCPAPPEMAVDLEPAHDLTLIFERDDVRDAFAGHCAKTHLDDDAVRTCTYCQGLRLTLARAIVEWLDIVYQSRAAPTEDHP